MCVCAKVVFSKTSLFIDDVIDEVIAVSEKVTVKLEDLAKWAQSDFSKWKCGFRAEPVKPMDVGKNGQKEALMRYRQSTLNSGLNFKDILKEKADLAIISLNRKRASGIIIPLGFWVVSAVFCRLQTSLGRVRRFLCRSFSYATSSVTLARRQELQDQNVEVTVTARHSEAQAILPQCLKMNVLMYHYVSLAKCCVIPIELRDLLQQCSGDVLFQYQKSTEQQRRAASPVSFLDLAFCLSYPDVLYRNCATVPSWSKEKNNWISGSISLIIREPAFLGDSELFPGPAEEEEKSCISSQEEHGAGLAEQPQLSQPVFTEEVLQPSGHFCGPPLDPPQQLHVLLVLRAPELDAVLWVGSYQSGVEGQNHLPRPAGHASFDAAQDTVGRLGCECALLAHVQLFVHQYPQVLFYRTALDHIIPQSLLKPRIAPTQVQDPALGLVEPHEVHTGPLLQLVQVPLDDIPSFWRVRCTTQLGVICKLAEGALDLAVNVIDENIEQHWSHPHVEFHLVTGKEGNQSKVVLEQKHLINPLPKAQEDPESPGEDDEDSNLLILSYPQYCRYRSMLKRIQDKPSSILTDQFVLALGGIAVTSKNPQIFYCRDTFDHPTLIENESICDEFDQPKGSGCAAECVAECGTELGPWEDRGLDLGSSGSTVPAVAPQAVSACPRERPVGRSRAWGLAGWREQTHSLEAGGSGAWVMVDFYSSIGFARKVQIKCLAYRWKE
ncbi:hypothetical protein QYF61_026507 [Mycteria americana]|uniref:Uncharacterized protein n=1 Tax=Mycteria americana TaxID=33587 RepID=A0AAN7P392_MYCAM|nr:hypothetical protein QYF61_026507 [Mycteria americana]